MFQEPSDNGADPDVFRLSRDPRQQTADASHHHRHRYTGHTRLLQFGNQVQVRDGVHLQHDPRRLAGLRQLDLPVDFAHHRMLELPRTGQQLLVGPREVGNLHVLEECDGILPDHRVSGHERQVGVLPACLFVVVACADLGDGADLAVALVGDQADLGVHLVVLESVNHGAAGVFQPLGHADVVGFIEPRPQLHERQDLLAVFRGGA